MESGTSAQPAPPAWLKWLLGLPVVLYRLHLGRLLGHRFLLLRVRGRRTGRHRFVMLEVVRHDRVTGESAVIAGWGRRTEWARNVEAGGAEWLWTAGESYRPVHRAVAPEEAEAILAAYERSNRVIAPVVRAVLSRLLGWRYDGSPASRRRAVEQLGMLAFRRAAG